MSDTNKYISTSKASSILDVSFERITWLIATGWLSSKRHPSDQSRKLVSLQDVHTLLNSPQLLAPWIIYALVDPRNGAIRYVGQTKEPQLRLRQHILEEPSINPEKNRWVRELEEQGLVPRMDVLEGLDGPLRKVHEREKYWVKYFSNLGIVLLNK